MAIDLDLPAGRTAVALEAVESGLAELVAALVDGGERDLTHEQLTELVARARRAQARLESVVLAAVGEVDARGSHVHDGALSPGAWLRMHTRATPAEAAATTRTARVLRSGALPATAAALAAGEISGRHAQVIAAGAADAPAGAVALIEPDAVAVAREADVRAVAALMRRFGHALDPDAADAAALRRHDRRGFTLAPTLDGSMALGGLADEVSGAVIATAVDAAGPPLPGDPRSPAQRRLDALTDICQAWLAGPHAPTGARPAQLIVVTDADTLAAGPGAPGSPGATMSWVGPVTGSTARRVGCDAEVTTVRLGPDGEVTETSTQPRFFTRAQRRAMIARDGDRCAVPYCDRPIAWSHGHHIVPASQGGPTTVGNGMLPCPGHHALLHEGHWRIQRLPDGRYQLRHRDGKVIGPEPHPPGHNRPPPHPRE